MNIPLQPTGKPENTVTVPTPTNEVKTSFWTKLKHTPKLFRKSDKLIVVVALLIVAAAAIYAGVSSYKGATVKIPQAGGTYIEGVVGEPKFINPLYDQTTDADQDITALVFSGLFRLDEHYQIVPDLAESYTISEDKKAYTIKLRDNVKWHDGEPLTANDVIFTMGAIQDQAYASPLRPNLKGITVEKVDEMNVKLSLRDPFAPFLTTLTFGILPAHIWESIPSQNAAVVEDNRKPVGTGPYKFFELKKEKETGQILSFTLEPNPDYFGGKAFIDKLQFDFFATPEDMIEAYNQKRIDGMNYIDAENLEKITRRNSTTHEYRLPVITSVFLNPSVNSALSKLEVRRALAHATNKPELINHVLKGHGIPVNGPLLPGFLGYTEEVDKFDFNIDKAKELLVASGYTLKAEDGFFYDKDGKKLTIHLQTTDWPQNTATANFLKESWKQAGVDLEVQVFTVAEIQQTFIRPRKFEALLFSQNIGLDSDLYPFWHSSQAFDPGLNLSFLKVEEIDNLLTSARASFDPADRAAKYTTVQKTIASGASTIFLFSPNYLYPTIRDLGGSTFTNISVPSDRFINAEDLYVKTKRVRPDSQ